MPKVSRAQRSEIQRNAHLIRQHGQRTGWGVAQIAAMILRQLPTVLPLEAWRLAYGWSRRQAIDGIAAIYIDDGIAPPPVNTSMLCRWEHATTAISFEYADALTRLYRASPQQLGLTHRTPVITIAAARGWYGRAYVTELVRTHRDPYLMTAGSDSGAAALAALRESLELALDAEGPAGGPLALSQFEAAVEYYALNYAVFSPAQLATEVHGCRALVTAALRANPPEAAQGDLRRVAGWLSALLGNLAFHLADHTAAHIHLGTAARLGLTVGDRQLVAWSLGAESMVARYQNRPVEALDLAQQALESADKPLHRAQILAWAQLRALARLGRTSQAHDTMRAAQRAMDADPTGSQPGRFGFDIAELELHIAEAHVLLGQHTPAADHANMSLQHTTTGRPGWAAATVVLAQAEARQGRPDQAASFGHIVLDTIPAQSLRDTTRQRLQTLDHDLRQLTEPGPQAAELHDRLTHLDPLQPPATNSEEPNGP